MRRFSLYCRNGIFYARFFNPDTRKWTSGRSTGERDEQAAMATVAYWERHGMPGEQSVDELVGLDTVLYTLRTAELTPAEVKRITGALKDRGLIESVVVAGDGIAAEPLIPLLRGFWEYDTSEYVREKHAYGQSIGRRHCAEELSRLFHWERFFGEDCRVGEITRERLQAFQMELHARELAASSINKILSAGTAALSWYAVRGDIEHNPAERLRTFTGPSAKRGILTPEETLAVFELEWKDERSRVGSLVAATCGLRSGEVLALRAEDIGEDRLHVRHSWSRADGLKAPKNSDTREQPLLPAVRDALRALVATNPHTPDGFVFYGPEPHQPMSDNRLRDGLARALVDMALPEDKREDEEARAEALAEWRERGVVFHSWRHAYAKALSDLIEMRKVQLATGHRTAAMTEHYANHANEEDFRQVAAAVTGAFGNILPFDRGKAAV